MTKGRSTERTFSALPPSRTVGTPSPPILAFRPHVQPSVLAVLRLMTSSYLVGFCTGRSAGFSPLRMRSM
jgi:hypothetical protein